MVVTIIGIIISVAIMTIAYACSENEYLILMTMVGAMFLFLFLHELCTQDEPSAMDVYRGKTTLKITYVDSVVVDSVAIFKEQ